MSFDDSAPNYDSSGTDDEQMAGIQHKGYSKEKVGRAIMLLHLDEFVSNPSG